MTLYARRPYGTVRQGGVDRALSAGREVDYSIPLRIAVCYRFASDRMRRWSNAGRFDRHRDVEDRQMAPNSSAVVRNPD